MKTCQILLYHLQKNSFRGSINTVFFTLLLSSTLQCTTTKQSPVITYAQSFITDSKKERAKQNYEYAITNCLTAISLNPNEPTYYERLWQCAKAYLTMPVDIQKQNELYLIVLSKLAYASKKFPGNSTIQELFSYFKTLNCKKI